MKKLLPILLLVTLLILAACESPGSKEVDENEWEVYTSNEHGYSINLPQGWASKESNANCTSFTSPQLKNYNEIWVETHPDVTDGDFFIGADLEICDKEGQPEIPYGDIKSQETLLVDGIQANRMDVVPDISNYSILQIPLQDKYLEVFYHPSEEWVSEEKFLEIFQTIEINQEIPAPIIEETPAQEFPEEDEPEEKRILLTPDLVDTLIGTTEPMDRCDMNFNFDSANSTAIYENIELSIQFTVPYSENWGTEEYYLAPYDTEGESVFFGPIGAFEGCGWSRIYRMNILPHRSADEILGELGDINKPEVKSINDLLLVEHTQEFCGSSIIEVIGENNNYQFSVICGEAFDELEEIVKTIQWLES